MDPELGDERVTSEALCCYHQPLEPENPPGGGQPVWGKKVCRSYDRVEVSKAFAVIVYLYVTCLTGHEDLQSLWIVQLQGKEDD